ncbi:metallophosphoesterase [Sphingobacterium multivorum]|uniref:metallophosphoesterase n=1 Tax=Sphingobacterium multivorum TaxID=28454 RepID=UPI003DA3E3FC
MRYLLLATLLVDLVHLFIKFNSRYFNFLTIGIALAVSIYGTLHSNTIHVKTLDIPVKGLTKDMKAVHLTDIHIGHFRNNPEYLQEIIAKTNAQQPDVIFLTGDYIDAELALDDKYFEPLKQFTAPVYFVEGNHDEYVVVNEIMEKMRKVGVRVLEDEMTTFGELQIIGLNFMPANRGKADRNTLSATSTVQEMLIKLKPDALRPTVVLHHGPNGIRYADEHGVDLYLAGHTHGGQLFPMTWVAQMDFEYNKGLHRYGNTNVFVSQGIGTYGPPMRVGTKSEIVLLNLKPQNRK